MRPSRKGAGGTTFLLAGPLLREGLVNEAYPETCWLQRSVDEKRAHFRQALAKENLTWPPKLGP